LTSIAKEGKITDETDAKLKKIVPESLATFQALKGETATHQQGVGFSKEKSNEFIVINTRLRVHFPLIFVVH
jgi:hypothetical protein